MRRLLISFQVILLFVYSAGAQMKTAREKTDLVGRVRTVRTEIAEIIKDGNRYTEGPYVRTNAAIYDAGMRLMEDVRSMLNVPVVTRDVFSYDSKERLAEVRQYNNGKLTSKRVCVYDASGKLVEEAHYAADDTPLFKFLYSYNTKGEQVEIAQENADGSRSLKVAFTYDSKGRSTRTTVCSSNAKSHSFIAENGKERTPVQASPTEMLSAPICEDGVIVSETSVTYDDDAALTSISEFLAGLPVIKRVLTHDVQRNLAEAAEYNPSGALRKKESFTYEFDSQGNWIKRTKWAVKGEESEPTEVIHRAITYYQ